MFRINQIFKSALLVTAISTTACADKDQGPEAGSVSFTVNVLSDEDTRSQITASDNMITSIELFIFDIKSGGLAQRVSFSEGEELTANNLARGREYKVYALANCSYTGKTKRIADMESVSISPGTLEQISENGLPMAGVSQQFSHDGNPTIVSISLERLVSKVFLTMDLSKMKGTFTIKEAALHNSAEVITPFAEGSAEETATTGDCATSVDLDRLNGGNSIALIAGENLQGTLLEGNTDPWQKTPENIAGKKDLCTYLSVKGDYYRDGLSFTDLCYNMYLGEDCTTNFDLRRNRIYNLTLSISDEAAALASSWKVDRGTTLDTRGITFNKQRDTILQYGSTTLRVTCTPSAFDYDIVEGEGFKETNLTYSSNGRGMITLKSGTIKQRSVTGRLWVRSWDRRKSAYCDLTVVKMDPSLLVPAKVFIEPREATIHIGDTLCPLGYIIYNSGDTLQDNSKFLWVYQGGSNVLRKPKPAAKYIGNSVGSTYAVGLLLENSNLRDSCKITVIQ